MQLTKSGRASGFDYVILFYIRYLIVARALGLAAVQPLGRVRASKGILHTSNIAVARVKS